MRKHIPYPWNTFRTKNKRFSRNYREPFENESVFLSTDNRATQRRKGKKRKGRFSHKQEHEDPDIQIEIVRHGSDNVRII